MQNSDIMHYICDSNIPFFLQCQGTKTCSFRNWTPPREGGGVVVELEAHYVISFEVFFFFFVVLDPTQFIVLKSR